MKGILHVCVCFSLSGYRYLPVSFLLHVKYSLSYRIVSQRRWHRSAWNFARWYISVLDRKSPLLGSVPPGIPNFGHLNANISKTASRSVTCQLELNIILKSVRHGAVVPLWCPRYGQMSHFFHHHQLWSLLQNKPLLLYTYWRQIEL